MIAAAPSLLAPRARAITWARRIVADPDVVWVDSETTALGETAEIVDLAILAHDGRVLLDTLVTPLNRIPAEAVRVHGITEAMIDRAKAPMWRELHPKLAALLRGKTVCGWNAGFDVGVIRRLCATADLADPIGCWQDAMLAYGDFDGTPNQWGTGMKWWKLGEACGRLGIDAGNHRARADAEACRLVVRAMAEAAL